MLISALTPVLAFLKRVPWFVWVALALLALWAFDRSAQYREGYREGAESVKAELLSNMLSTQVYGLMI